jgi:hypothetical protein
MAAAALPGADGQAVNLLAELIAGHYPRVCEAFDATMTEKLDADAMAAVWAQLTGFAGDFQGLGDPVVFQAGDYTVVDVPLSFEAGQHTGRVSLDHAGRVAGLFFLPAETPRNQEN